MSRETERRANELFSAAQAKSAEGDEQTALSLYLESLAVDRDQPAALYNVGLIYKYRRDWRQSLRYNQMAAEMQPRDESTNWNIGIAATALREWRIARDAWRTVGIKVEAGFTAIEGDFGYTPVRLNAFEQTDAAVEVVWASRVSPVTARIRNIPTPESRFRFEDVVLHDGAANGTRLFAPGDERPVFDALDLFEPSEFVTYDVGVVAPGQDAINALHSACEAVGVEMEDWTKNMQSLCKACSEGRAHAQHDHSPKSGEWQTERRVGFASKDDAMLDAVLQRWSAGGHGRKVQR
jgi:hypothetical protein